LVNLRLGDVNLVDSGLEYVQSRLLRVSALCLSANHILLVLILCSDLVELLAAVFCCWYAMASTSSLYCRPHFLVCFGDCLAISPVHGWDHYYHYPFLVMASSVILFLKALYYVKVVCHHFSSPDLCSSQSITLYFGPLSTGLHLKGTL
jgi:hypothetical protein